MPRFDANKATDAVALLVKLAGGQLNRVAVLRLLYFAERDAIATYGSVITRVTFFAMRHGPVASEVLDLIKGKITSNRWSEYLMTVGDNLVLKQEPSDDYLCEAHEELIRKHWDTHKHSFNPTTYPTALVQYSHSLPEWVDPGEGRVQITKRQLLEINGWSSEDIEVVDENDWGIEWWESRSICTA
ncbi:MAG: Panacea domain-containing protein [Polyangiaceae bacterium]|nr:Panacea domain-containing protein [Polyangiaceae bacterium]